MAVRLSVITPSWNQGAFIERTIRSVLDGQMNVEYLVVDGASSDQTVDILKRYEDRLSWISEPDRGQADAVNKGIARTHGELIGWLNSDDIYYPGAIVKAAQFLQTHPEIDVVYGNAYHIDPEDRIIEPYPTQQWDARKLRESCFLCQPAVFFRRKVVEEHGPLDASLRYCMDYEYWLRLADAGVKFAYLPELLAGSRLHGQTKTLGQRRQAHEEINDMLYARYGRVPERWLLNYSCICLGLDRTAERPNRLKIVLLPVEYVRSCRRWKTPISCASLLSFFRGLAVKVRNRLRAWHRGAGLVVARD